MKEQAHRSARWLRGFSIAAAGSIGAFLLGYAIIGLVADYYAPARIEAEAARSSRPTAPPAASSSIAAPSPTSPIAVAERFPPGPLTKYEGAYSFDIVGERTFLDEPVVMSTVERIVSDPDVLGWVLTNPVASPIRRANGYLRAGACEQHNCGPHHWTIFIDDVGEDAAVCYYDEESNASPRWFGDEELVRSLAQTPRQSELPGCP